MLASPGMITPTYELTSPILFSIRKRGSIVTCAGMTIEAIRNLNNGSRPRNLYFAKAYPAIELITSERAVTLSARKALLRSARAMFILVRTPAYCSSVTGCGIHGGGNVLACPGGISDAATIQTIGANETIATAIAGT